MELPDNLINPSSEQQKPQQSSLVCSKRTDLLKSRYGPLENFLRAHNPSTQLAVCENSSDCIFGDHPTLATVRAAYGYNAPIAWLVPQLYNLSEYCGCKDKLNSSQLEELAGILTANYYWLKVSEMMLFFHRFKSGMYGRFYGSIDPLVIMSSMRTFVGERNVEIDRHEREESARRLAESRKNAITYTEYLKIMQEKEEQEKQKKQQEQEK